VTNLSLIASVIWDRRKADWKIMKDANIISIAIGKFDASKWPLEDSGLLGP